MKSPLKPPPDMTTSISVVASLPSLSDWECKNAKDLDG